METGYPEAAATLVALADGTASIYFSSGGGVIGGAPHPSINAAARRMVGLAQGYLTSLSPTAQFPLPREGEVKVYVLTTNGVLASDADEKALLAGGASALATVPGWPRCHHRSSRGERGAGELVRRFLLPYRDRPAR